MKTFCALLLASAAFAIKAEPSQLTAGATKTTTAKAASMEAQATVDSTTTDQVTPTFEDLDKMLEQQQYQLVS
jgi:hypothetical protein